MLNQKKELRVMNKKLVFSAVAFCTFPLFLNLLSMEQEAKKGSKHEQTLRLLKIISADQDFYNGACFGEVPNDILTTSDDGKIVKHKLQEDTFTVLKKFENKKAFIESDINALYHLVAFSDHAKVIVYDWKSKELVKEFDSLCMAQLISLDPAGKWLAAVVGAKGGKAILSSLGDGSRTVLNANKDFISTLCFDKKGNAIAFASDKGSIKLWDLAKQKLKDGSFQVGNGWVNRLAFSTNDELLAVSTAKKVELINIKNNTIIFTTPCENAACLTFDRKSKYLAIGCQKITQFAEDTFKIDLWNLKKSKKVAEASLEELLLNLEFSSDNKKLLACTPKNIVIYELI